MPQPRLHAPGWEGDSRARLSRHAICPGHARCRVGGAAAGGWPWIKEARIDIALKARKSRGTPDTPGKNGPGAMRRRSCCTCEWPCLRLVATVVCRRGRPRNADASHGSTKRLPEPACTPRQELNPSRGQLRGWHSAATACEVHDDFKPRGLISRGTLDLDVTCSASLSSRGGGILRPVSPAGGVLATLFGEALHSDHAGFGRLQ